MRSTKVATAVVLGSMSCAIPNYAAHASQAMADSPFNNASLRLSPMRDGTTLLQEGPAFRLDQRRMFRTHSIAPRPSDEAPRTAEHHPSAERSALTFYATGLFVIGTIAFRRRNLRL